MMFETNLSFEYCLPSEIWENIIEYLENDPYSLVVASRVCRLWRHLVARFCQKYCIALNSRLLAELKETAVNHKKCSRNFKKEYVTDILSEEWILVYELFQETKLLGDRVVEQFIPVGEVNHVLSATTAGPYLILTTYDEENPLSSSKLHIFNSAFSMQDINAETSQPAEVNAWKTINANETIFNTWLLTVPTPILLMHTCHQYLRALIIRDYEKVDDIRKECLLTNCRIKANYKLCTEENLILTQTDEDDFLTLYMAFLPLEEPHEVRVTEMLIIKPESRLHCWDLCRGLVTTIETSGHARVYKIKDLDESFQLNFPRRQVDVNDLPDAHDEQDEENATIVAQSGFKNDLRYLNPVLLSQNFIFSSTYNSKMLLLYWHMDRDLDYWLCGTITKSLLKDKHIFESCEVPSYIHLHKLILGPPTSTAEGVITAIHFQRGILFCGTKDGQILAYRVREELDEDLLFQSLCDSPIIDAHNVIPGPVNQLAAAFTPAGILVAAAGKQDRRIASIIFFPASEPEKMHACLAGNLMMANK